MVAVVTGGAKGIGRKIVEKLVEDGYKVAFCYNTSEEQAMELCSNLNSNSSLNCIGIKCDVRDSENVKNFIEEVIKVFGQIDIVVNNAGIANYNLLMDMQVKEWKNVMSTNLDSVFYTCKYCLPYMLNKGGSIINISSVWGVCIRTRRTIPAPVCLAVPGSLSVSLSPPFSFLLPLSSTRAPSPSPWPRSSGLCHLSVPVSLPSLPHGDESGTRIPARVPDERCGLLSGVPGQAASQVRVPCSRCACRSVGASL